MTVFILLLLQLGQVVFGSGARGAVHASTLGLIFSINAVFKKKSIVKIFSDLWIAVGSVGTDSVASSPDALAWTGDLVLFSDYLFNLYICFYICIV